jgi:hypothetical protein
MSGLFLLMLACGRNGSDGTPAGTPGSTTLPAESPIARPTQSPTAAPPQRPGADTAPSGNVSGIAEIDAILTPLVAGDARELAGLVRLTETACTTLQGVGLPPPYALAPGSPPDGSLVKAFPLSGCEGEWTYDAEGAFRRLLMNEPHLFAVIALDTPMPVLGSPTSR